MQRTGALILGLALTLLLSACAGGPQVSSQEHFKGQLAAGVVGPAGPQGPTVQRRLIDALSETGRFAGVFPLWSASQNTEAQVIVVPSVIEAQRGSGGYQQIALQLQAYVKYENGQRLEKAYSARATGSKDALSRISSAASRDLARRFGSKPVY